MKAGEPLNFHQQEGDEIIFVSEEEAGERIDTLLAKRFQNIQSRSYFQKLIDENKILLNNVPIKKRTQPKAGDEIQIDWVLTPEIGLKPEAIPLNILYEDEHLLAINKPVGMVVHPAVGHWTGTFVNALLHHCHSLPQSKESMRPGIVHRLDKDTSGVLIAAKNSLAQQRLVELFASRQIYKEYLAICVGNPGNAELSGAIGRHPIHRQMMTVLPSKGKAALSICKTLASDGKLSLASVILATGRTHQIRVHLKHHGTPVLGDVLYGSSSVNAKHGATRQLLHAKILRFNHPITGEMLQLDAELPEDMALWVKKFTFL